MKGGAVALRTVHEGLELSVFVAAGAPVIEKRFVSGGIICL
jgi:hypothetical protein